VPGVYAGFLQGFLFGDAFDKVLSFRMGQTHVQKDTPDLLEMIGEGRLHPEAIVTHQMGLEQAAQGYEMFDQAQDECGIVVLIRLATDPFPEARLYQLDRDVVGLPEQEVRDGAVYDLQHWRHLLGCAASSRPNGIGSESTGGRTGTRGMTGSSRRAAIWANRRIPDNGQ